MAKPDGGTGVPPLSWHERALCGHEPERQKTLTPELINWADIICVMEQKHKNRLVAEYRRLVENKPLYVLDIPDDYRYMDPELVALLKELVPALPELS